jgi:hypothetical protein
MTQHFSHLQDIFSRTQNAIDSFMGILHPAIDQAKDEHERLYYHHIFEEEDHRLDRLREMQPKLDVFIESDHAADTNNREFVSLLQDISLEKFGLHNFLEHLDLALFHFKDSESHERLQSMRDITYEDYQAIKEILLSLNSQYDDAANSAGSTPTDEKDHVDQSFKVDLHSKVTDAKDANPSKVEVNKPLSNKKGLTVGSLKK